MTARVAGLTGTDLERGIAIFSRVSQRHGAKAWSLEDASAAGLGLYRATVSEHWVLDPAERPDRRTPVNP
jgi:hypothetical protein